MFLVCYGQTCYRIHSDWTRNSCNDSLLVNVWHWFLKTCFCFCFLPALEQCFEEVLHHAGTIGAGSVCHNIIVPKCLSCRWKSFRCRTLAVVLKKCTVLFSSVPSHSLNVSCVKTLHLKNSISHFQTEYKMCFSTETPTKYFFLVLLQIKHGRFSLNVLSANQQ